MTWTSSVGLFAPGQHCQGRAKEALEDRSSDQPSVLLSVLGASWSSMLMCVCVKTMLTRLRISALHNTVAAVLAKDS